MVFENYKCSHANPFWEKPSWCPRAGLLHWGETNLPLWANGTLPPRAISPHTLLCCPVHILPRLPEDLHCWGLCGVFLLPPPRQPPPLPHPHTHPSSHPLGTYLSVAFIHNPRDLNLFPPHRPRLFLSLLSLKNFMPFSSLSSVFFFFLFNLPLSLYLPFFFRFLFVPINSKIPASVPARKKNEGGGGEDEH